MKMKIIMAALTGLVIILMASQASASLVPMSWGYPQMTQSNSLTAFQKDTAQTTDEEAAAVSFGASASDLCGSTFGTSLPTISQTGVQSSLLSSVKFQNENSCSAFAYPFLSIGSSILPSMGFL